MLTKERDYVTSTSRVGPIIVSVPSKRKPSPFLIDIYRWFAAML